jgi:uncharacterized protein involved in response to NO
MAMTVKAFPDPYRLFFPLGLALGFAGIAIWPLMHFGLISGYWGLSHAFLQSEGFLFCFIAGFLLTALPRFTGTKNPSFGAQLLLALCVVAGAVALELHRYQIAHVMFFIAYVTFAVLLAKRFLKRDREPPDTFALIGYGVLAGFVAALFNMLTSFEIAPLGLPTAGKRLLTEGMTLLLVLGVGGFLGPRLLGFETMSLVQVEGVAQKPKLPRRTLFAIAGALILISILCEHLLSLGWMNPLRALIATIVIAITIEPWRLPLAQTTLARCVWSANIMTIAGLWLAALFPAYRVDLLHVLFIGSFTLLILAVGMRVILSHGGHGLEPERKNWPLRIGLVLGSLAMLARVGARLHSESYSEHLVYASVLLLIALAIWGWRTMQLIFGANSRAS